MDHDESTAQQDSTYMMHSMEYLDEADEPKIDADRIDRESENEGSGQRARARARARACRGHGRKRRSRADSQTWRLGFIASQRMACNSASQEIERQASPGRSTPILLHRLSL